MAMDFWDRRKEQETGIEVHQVSDIVRLQETLEALDRLRGRFCLGEKKDVEKMYKLLCVLVNTAKRLNSPDFRQVAQACRDYLLRLAKQDLKDVKPIDEALLLLKSIVLHIKIHRPFEFDYAETMDMLLTNVEHAPAQRP